MHSSGMHTARLLTVPQHALHRGGGCLAGAGAYSGVSARGGCLPTVVSAQREVSV